MEKLNLSVATKLVSGGQRGSSALVPSHPSQPHAGTQRITAAEIGTIFQSILTFLSYLSLKKNQMRKTAGVFRMGPTDLSLVQWCGDERPELAASTVSELNSLAIH